MWQNQQEFGVDLAARWGSGKSVWSGPPGSGEHVWSERVLSMECSCWEGSSQDQVKPRSFPPPSPFPALPTAPSPSQWLPGSRLQSQPRGLLPLSSLLPLPNPSPRVYLCVP